MRVGVCVNVGASMRAAVVDVRVVNICAARHQHQVSKVQTIALSSQLELLTEVLGCCTEARSGTANLVAVEGTLVLQKPENIKNSQNGQFLAQVSGLIVRSCRHVV